MLGLMISFALLFSSQVVKDQIIWESSTPKDSFSFNGYTKVMINPAFLPEKSEDSVVAALKKKGKVVFITKIDERAYDAIAQNQMAFHILKTQTDDPETALVECLATTTQKDKINGSLYSSRVWEKLFVIHRTGDSEEEIHQIIDQTVREFLSQFQSKDLVFYFPDPLKKYDSSNR